MDLLLKFGLDDGSISEMSAGYRDAEKMSGPQIAFIPWLAIRLVVEYVLGPTSSTAVGQPVPWLRAGWSLAQEPLPGCDELAGFGRPR